MLELGARSGALEASKLAFPNGVMVMGWTDSEVRHLVHHDLQVVWPILPKIRPHEVDRAVFETRVGVELAWTVRPPERDIVGKRLVVVASVNHLGEPPKRFEILIRLPAGAIARPAITRTFCVVIRRAACRKAQRDGEDDRKAGQAIRRREAAGRVISVRCRSDHSFSACHDTGL
ncbi:MAG: hypothetical protein ABI779_07045 [Acidobacteriota bacterium]